MPYCPQCPGRFFKDENGLRNHQDSRHLLECQYCDRTFTTEKGRDAHQEAKHASMFECEYCDREFATDQGRLSHQQAKHPPMFECHYCDREFNSEESREQHENAKHTFECRYCEWEFRTEEAREQHEKAKHTFECRYCDREFNSEQAREQHENAKHMSFECHYCNMEFSSEQACDQHEGAEHSIFDCPLCERDFSSVDALRQHQDAKHPPFGCRHCSQGFTSEAARLQHEGAVHFQSGGWGPPSLLPLQHKVTPHIQCSYCSVKFSTQDSKNEHEEVCLAYPAKRADLAPPSPPSLPGSLPSNDLMSMVIADEEMSDSIQSVDTPTSPCPSSDSPEGELYHSMSGIYSTGANGGSFALEQPCTCAHSLERSTCSICQQASSALSNAGNPAPEDAGNALSADDTCEDDSIRTSYSGPHICTPCLQYFGTMEAFQSHVCPALTTMLQPHCSTCYTSFDDWALVQEHVDNEIRLCRHCQTRCCSDEMMQDHLLDHPTCSKCGKSFADDLALCAHVETDHPVVICWDCDGVVVERGGLELHYTDSPAHPSCAFCGIGTRDSADMDQHVRDMHTLTTETEDQLEGDKVNAGVPVAEGYTPGESREETIMQHPAESTERTDRMRSPSAMEIMDTLSDPEARDLMHSSLQTDVPLFSSSQPPIPSPVKHIDEQIMNPHVIKEEERRDVDLRQAASPSPTPSEHGSDESRSQSIVTAVTNMNNEGLPSPATSVSAEPFSDMSPRSSPSVSPTSSSQSVVFVSADGIPDYIRENRAILVATSSRSSSGREPFPSSSTSSLAASLDVRASMPSHGSVTHRLHCRICLRDPCEDMTATMCGHVFCKRCITRAVVATSECPVCKSATLLYCLFQLRLSD